MTRPDWQTLILNPDWLARLERQAAKRFAEVATAEEAVTHVLDRLAENNWARCQHFGGHARPATFLFSVAAHLLEEFARKRYGRARPPQWLQQQGELWLTLWRRLCLERTEPDAVIAQLCAGGHRDESLLRNIARTIKARLPWCGASQLPIPEEYLGGHGADETAAPATLEDNLCYEHLHETLALLGALLDGDHELDTVTADTIARCRAQLQLGAEELLMLRMHFQDGLSFSAIARALGIGSHLPGRHIKRSLDEIRRALTAAGLDLDTALDTLNADSA